jgi:fimbrial chaperone protein
MDLRASAAVVTIVAVTGAGQALAGALEVAPVKIQVDLPQTATTVTVSNPGSEPIAAQLRIFRWSHRNGRDELAPTRDVVASPPLTQLAPGQPYVVRIVRVAKAPVQGEESYRLIVDEIPDPRTARPNFGPRFAIRQSIPIFFSDPAAAPKLAWQASITNGKLLLSASNSGSKRVRISALKVSDSSGTTLTLGNGFAGYVFGGSTEQWAAKAGTKGFSPGGTIMIVAQGENGPIKATATILAAN